MSMKLNKDAIVPIIKGIGFVSLTPAIWKGSINEKAYLVDFNKNQICRFDDGNYRVDVDESDDDLKYVKETCVTAMFSKEAVTETQEEHNPLDCESIPDDHTFEDIHGPIDEPYEPSVEIINTDVTKAANPCKTVTHNQHIYTNEQVNTIKNTVARGANNDELSMFMHIAQTYGLDPFMKEIFYSSQMKTIMTSRDGYLKIAQRDPNFDGLQSMAVCENDDFSIDMQNNTVKHSFGKGARGQVIGAWAICYHKERKPVIAYADYSEYNKGNNIWKTYKSAMSCKVAEGFVLKRQFGISGLVTVEEME